MKKVLRHIFTPPHIFYGRIVTTTGTLADALLRLKYFMVILLFIVSGGGNVYAQCSIGGAGVMCAGSSAPLSGSPGGGTWNSANTSIATVSGSGMVTGVNAGTAVISYHNGACWATKTVTVNTAPTPISGPGTVCTGSNITLSDGVGGGSWTASGSHITGTISGANYVITGNTAGTGGVTYTVGTGGNMCPVYATITVNATPNPINGQPLQRICVGNTLNLSDNTPGGVWSSSATSVATATNGVMTGVSAGATTISYTVGSCSATAVATVNTTPAAIGGPNTVCTGATITLTNSVGGGTWTFSGSNIGGGATGGNFAVNGNTSGTGVVTYTTGTGANACPVYTTITVNPTGSIVPAMPEVCVGATLSMTNTTAPGGTWSSAATATATINASTGSVVGISANTVTIDYTLSTGCNSSVVLTVNADPTITGSNIICVGSTETLTPSIGGGTWSSSNTGIATATNSGSNGVITGVSQGSATVSYEITATGCGITTTIVDNTTAAISGSNQVCSGSTITLSDATLSGTWSSGDNTVATVDPVLGIVTGVTTTAQTVSISYTTGCGPTVSSIITVNPLPTVNVTATTAAFCVGSSTGLNASGATTYLWVADVSLSATTGSSVTASPTANDVYTVTGTDGNGCQNTTTVAVTVNQLPNVGASDYAPDVCIGSSTGLTATGAATYIWSADPTLSGTTGAAVTATPTVTNTYSVVGTDGNGCQNAATVSVTVNSPPTISASASASSVCFGSSSTLTATGGVSYAWTYDPALSSNTGSSVTVTPTVTNTYSVVGTDGNGCQNTANISISVNPVATITGSNSVFVGGADTLQGSLTGGTWNSSDTTLATVDANGIVTGIDSGMVNISYSLVTGCITNQVVNIYPAYSIVSIPSGINEKCVGSAITLSIGTPGGAWTSSNTSVATVASVSGTAGEEAVVTLVGAGTATISYAYGVSISRYTIYVLPSCLCAAFSSGVYFTPLGLTGVIPAGTYNGDYIIYNNTTINGNATFNGAVVDIAPNVVVSVAPTVTVGMYCSHFFSCGGMWGGFQMLTTAGVSTASMVTNDGVLIEDATTAISFANPVTPTTGYLLNCNNTVFNQNGTGVNINYTVPTATFPFYFTNTMFTSRDFTSYYGVNCGYTNSYCYPRSWPYENGLTAPWAPALTEDLPYNIDNPGAEPLCPHGIAHTVYTPALTESGAEAFIGIQLNNVGTGSTFASLIGANFNWLFFDNMNYGIFATNSNLTVNKCTFSYMNMAGIYASIVNPGNIHGLTVGSSDANNFYNCLNSIQTSNMNYLNIQYSNIYSNRPTSGYATPCYGICGINMYVGNVGAMGSTMQYTINHNYVANVNTGINYVSVDESVTGNVTIQDNKLMGATADLPIGLGYMNNGIVVNNSSTATVPLTGSALTIRGNKAESVYNGIVLNSFNIRIPTIDSNDILIAPQTGTIQYGISYTNNYAPTFSVTNNFVTSIFGTSSYVTPPSTYNMIGFDAENNTPPVSVLNKCNNSQYMNVGYNFVGAANLHLWKDNYMQNCAAGYQLNGAIGPQPNVLGTYPSNNQWGGTWSYANPQTYNLSGVAPTASKLYVQTSCGICNPTFNSAFGGPALAYSSATGTLLPSAGTPDANCAPTSASWRITGDSSANDSANRTGAIYVLQLIAMDSIFYSDTGTGAFMDSNISMLAEKSWIAQYAAYNAIANDTSGYYVDSSAALATFYELAQSSRFYWLNQIAQTIDTGNYTGAQTLMSLNIDSMANIAYDTTTSVAMQDSTTADDVVQNYLTYYKLYINYINTSLSSNDSTTLSVLANLCPATAGNIVYTARALYDMVFDSIGNFSNVCGADSGARFGNTKAMNSQNKLTGQQYHLYPNPNNGNITLMQYILDSKPVLAEVVNSYGQLVKQYNLQFTNYAMQLNFGNLTSGLYLLHLTDSYGSTYIIKFVKE